MPMTNLQDFILKNDFMLAEAAVVERLRRMPGLALHPRLEHSPLIYSEQGRQAMCRVYHEYLDVARHSNTAILLQTPTWRANWERVQQSGLDTAINRDATGFMRDMLGAYKDTPPVHWLAGLLGCKNDCYRPDEGLSAPEAERFHRWQIDELVESGVDCLFAATLPSVDEALGIANATHDAEVPIYLSFVIDKEGCVLDGTPLHDAVIHIDNQAKTLPAGYFVNCSYPTFINAPQQPPALFQRLFGIQANASSLEHCELDGCAELQAESISNWGDAMLGLNQQFGVKVLGGCCGTDADYLKYLTDHLGN